MLLDIPFLAAWSKLGGNRQKQTDKNMARENSARVDWDQPGDNVLLHKDGILHKKEGFEIFLVTFGHFLQNGHWIYQFISYKLPPKWADEHNAHMCMDAGMYVTQLLCDRLSPLRIGLGVLHVYPMKTYRIQKL